MTTNKATSRTPVRARTPEDQIQYMRRRAIARLVLATLTFCGGGGYLITHWPQEHPITTESMARLEWKIEGNDAQVTREEPCKTPSALDRLRDAADNVRTMLAKSGAPVRTDCGR